LAGFEIFSDHKPLVWLNNTKEPIMKLKRWKIKLNEFDYKIKYLPGKENHVAMTRRSLPPQQTLNEHQPSSRGNWMHWIHG